jgi:hypothetical protein
MTITFVILWSEFMEFSLYLSENKKFTTESHVNNQLHVIMYIR